MKGILLAGGRGARLYPMTLPVCKPLLPVFDKPMIFYPLATLMYAGVRDVLIIVPDGEQSAFEQLLGDGSRYGIHISYAVQKKPRGIADALLVGESFIGGDRVCLALGDNIFFSDDVASHLRIGAASRCGATVFGYYHPNPQAFGVVEFDDEGHVLSLEEKPAHPKSNYVVPGLYFYDEHAVQFAKTLTPSARGELEITDLNSLYMQRGDLSIHLLPRKFLWMDAGTPSTLLAAAVTIKNVQGALGHKIAVLEEIALQNGWITAEDCLEMGQSIAQSDYGQYLIRVAQAYR